MTTRFIMTLILVTLQDSGVLLSSAGNEFTILNDPFGLPGPGYTVTEPDEKASEQRNPVLRGVIRDATNGETLKGHVGIQRGYTCTTWRTAGIFIGYQNEGR